MRWGTVRLADGTRTAALWKDERIISVAEINRVRGTQYPLSLERIISQDMATEVAKASEGIRGVSADQAAVLAPLSYPERIVGIGLNFRAHASDLSETVPEEPATFLKPQSSIIGPGDTISIPKVSERTTAEAEIALVFGRTSRDVSPHAWKDVIFGIVPVLDMTTEDILRKNPRFLTRSKGYDTFFSFGPWIATLDEFPDLSNLVVETVVNDEVKARNAVSGMTYGPDALVAFITTGVTIGATAVLSTGTPGAAVIRDGDVVKARVSGLGVLTNPVAGTRR